MNSFTTFFRKLAQNKKVDPANLLKTARQSKVTDTALQSMIGEASTGKSSYDKIASVHDITGAHLRQLIQKRGTELGHTPEVVFEQHMANRLQMPKVANDLSDWDKQLYTSRAQFTTIARRFDFTPEQLRATADPEALKFFKEAEIKRVAKMRQKRAQMETKTEITKSTEKAKSTTATAPAAKMQQASKGKGGGLPSPRVSFLSGTPAAKNELNKLKGLGN